MSVNVVLKSVFDDKGIKNATKAFDGIGGSLGKVAGLLGAAFSVGAVVNFGKEALGAAEEAAVANARLEQIAESMGIFGNNTSAVTTRLKEFADQQMMVIGQDDELIKSTQAKLLTFKELAATADEAGGSFDRATIAAFDLAAAGFGSAETNAVQLGKALQDPIKGITALTRSGVTFTDAEKEKIKVLVESGRTLEAQNMILSAIEQQVGGTAAATVTSTQKMGLIFGELTETLGSALLPAAEQVALQLQSNLVPIIQELGDYLQSPAGRQAIDEFANSVGQLVVDLIDAATWFKENFKVISTIATPILSVVAGLVALKTALELAKVAQLAFNLVALANPYVLAASAIILGITGIVAAFQLLNSDTKENTAVVAESSGELNRFNNIKLDGIKGEINSVANAATNAATAIRAMAPVQGPGLLPSGQSLISGPRPEDFPLNPKPGQVYTWYKWENVGGTTLAVWYTQTWDGTKWSAAKKMTTAGGGGSASSTTKDAETTAERFAKVQAVIKKAQKAIADAEEAYAGERFRIQQDYETSVLRLQTDAAQRQLDLVNESKARITDAFRDASRVSLTDLFDTKTTRELETTVKKLTSNLTVTVTKETEKTAFSSVDTLVAGLREKLNASKNLLANASQLASEGFSQTFIEEVISAGTETGNALADAILQATPETKSELQGLYSELETVGETGAQALADDLYNTFGLATRGLKEQSALVAQELKDSLEEQNKALAKSLADAGLAFGIAIRDIKDTFLSDLEQFDGWFAGLGRTIDQLLAKMEMLSGKSLTQTQAALTAATSGTVLAGATVQSDVAITTLQNAQGLVVDSMNDVAGTAAYLEARIAAANTYIKSSSSNQVQELSAATKIADWTTALANLEGAAATGSAAGTVININVKTDTTQSQAMVGKTIGNIVTKYVTTGGEVLVSGNN